MTYRILAVASGGGHWTQMMRMRPALQGADVVFVTTLPGLESQVKPNTVYITHDASRFDIKPLFKIVRLATRLISQFNPDAIITTGSAPALPFVMIGKLRGKKILWIDSIANSEKLSSSARIAGKMGATVVSQWPEVAKGENVLYWGQVI